MNIHVARAGESLFSVALRYGVPLEQLVFDNGIAASAELLAGQSLLIRFPLESYAVRSGDTLRSIARKTGLSLRELLAKNPGCAGEDNLSGGELLTLHVAHEPTHELAVLGYAPPDMPAGCLRSILPYLTGLATAAHRVTETGELLAPADEPVLAAAEELGVSGILHLSACDERGRFPQDGTALMLADESLQGKLIGQIGKALYRKGYRGIDVDLGCIYPEDARCSADFIRRLSSTFNPFGIPVTVALAAKTGGSGETSHCGRHDDAALGAAANSVLLMTSERGCRHGPPMPLAPLPQVQAALDDALSRIPAEKILMELPDFGCDWTLPFVSGVSSVRGVGSAEALRLAQQHSVEIFFDETSSSPYFTYTAADGSAHIVHFEDARSMAAKLALAIGRGLYGVGCRNLMRSSAQNWRLLASLTRIRPV